MLGTSVILGRLMLKNNEGRDDAGRPPFRAAAATFFGMIDFALLDKMVEYTAAKRRGWGFPSPS